MIDIEILKWEGQKHISKHTLAMSMIFDRQTELLMMILRWCHESLLGPGMEELLQLKIAFLNSTFEKESQPSDLLSWSSSSRLKSICLSWVLLKVEWSTFQRLSISRYSWLLNLIALTARSLCLLIQFIRSHGPAFLLAISWIFWSNLVFLIVFLNTFQSFIFFILLYLSRVLLQLVSHQLLKCLVILIVLEWWFQRLLADCAIVWTMFSREFSSCISKVLIVCIEVMNLLMKFFSSLSLIKTHFLVEKHSSKIGMQIDSVAWSEMSYQSGWISWLLNSSDPCLRNMRSMTEFELCLLSIYLVGIWLVGMDKLRSKASVTSKRISLWEE